jgi:hypothetical protein
MPGMGKGVVYPPFPQDEVLGEVTVEDGEPVFSTPVVRQAYEHGSESPVITGPATGRAIPPEALVQWHD